MDDATRRETLLWVKKSKKDLIEKTFLIYEHLSKLEAMLNE